MSTMLKLVLGCGGLIRARAAAVGVMFALAAVPISITAGVAVDYARLLQYRANLQAAADAAALAGAAAFNSPSQSSNAADVARNYFYHRALGFPGTITSVTVTPNTNGTINPAIGNASAYTVSVSANASISRSFLSLIGQQPFGMSVTATAANPLIQPNITFSNIGSTACDGNTAYLYLVPAKSGGNGYDFTKVPQFSVSSGTPGHYTQGNYYEIGTSYAGSSSPYAQLPPGQQIPTITANQPLGFMLRNDTNGNTGNPSCGAAVTGANSWGAPNGASQAFYSSLILANNTSGSPSDQTNYTYQAAVTYSGGGGWGGGWGGGGWGGGGWGGGGSQTITSVTVTLPPSVLYPNGATITEPIASSQYNNLSTYLGINDPNSGYSNCSSHTSGSTTTYTCQTQYRTSSTSATPNCSLYIQTGVSQSYINNLSSSTPSPSAAVPNCFSPKQSWAQYAAPTCAQLSQLGSGSGPSATAPAIVVWWDDAGGVGPGEQYYGPASHCTTMPANSPGYGEDCQYHNNFFAVECTINGGSGSSFSMVLLTE